MLNHACERRNISVKPTVLEEAESHLAVRMSVSDSLACIRHRPVEFREHHMKNITVMHLNGLVGKSEWSFTWEDKDETSCQSSNQRDHSPDVWDEEGEDEGDDEPHQGLQDPPPLLTTHTHLHLLALKTQPKSFYNCPANMVTHGHTRAQWGNCIVK